MSDTTSDDKTTSDGAPVAGADEQSAAGGGDLHNMGGAIGAASIRGAGAPAEGGPDDTAAPKGGYSTPVSPMVGSDADDPGVAGSTDADVVAPVGHEVVAGTRSNYVPEESDDVVVGRGADGDTAARQEQKDAGAL